MSPEWTPDDEHAVLDATMKVAAMRTPEAEAAPSWHPEFGPDDVTPCRCGQLGHLLPTEHVIRTDCWCQPTAERQPDGSYVVIHKAVQS